MAENQQQQQQASGKSGSGGILAAAQKRLARTKTKVLQNLGKAEKTTDDVFTENVQKIERQQDVGQHLQKEIKNYMHCLRDLCQASKSLHSALADTYEAEWTEESTFKSQLQAFELLWNDYIQNLQDKLVNPMQTYLQSFPAIRNKVAKRGRKMVDYDNSRHHLEVLQAAKKKDDVKIQRAQEELKEAKRIYDQMNNELHTELPDFYNSRVTFYASLFSSLFSAEYVFHSEQGKINGTLGDISERLAKDFEQFVYKPKRPLSKSVSNNSGENGVNGEMSGASSPSTSMVGTPLSSATNTPAKGGSEVLYTNQEATDRRKSEREEEVPVNGDRSGDSNGEEDDEEKEEESGESNTSSPRVQDGENEMNKEVQAVSEKEKQIAEENLYEQPEDESNNATTSTPAPLKVTTPEVNDHSGDEDNNESDSETNLYSHPPSNRPVVAPPESMLYMVQATHKYTGEDVDELEFEPGEIIYVIPFENPEEQDDGWQMGIKKSDGVKGVFPENFTQKL